MKKTKLILLTVFIVLPGLIFAQPGNSLRPGPPELLNGGPGMEQDHIEQLKNRLGLSDKQVDSIIKIIIEHKKKTERLQIKIMKLDLDVRELLLKDNPPLTKIEQLIKEKCNIVAKDEFEKIKMDIQIKALFTSEQKQKWEYFIKTIKPVDKESERTLIENNELSKKK